jgi:hypothetical protein
MAFADVAPDDEEPMTLLLPLQAQGDPPKDAVHELRRVSDVDGYRVELLGDVLAGAASDLSFRITRDGRPIIPDPYLGAAGHLVAIRSGDLEYLHVHPMEGKDPGAIHFMMHAPGSGLHRLFLQFLHEGQVRTCDFSVSATVADAQPGSHQHG